VASLDELFNKLFISVKALQRVKVFNGFLKDGSTLIDKAV